MGLRAGSLLGAYEIVEPLGAGGMGEVYRAKDSRLGRDVAIKVLPEAFAFDADRVARFEREAKVLASLNHPHIAQIYGVERQGDGASGLHTFALVMELVDGPSLHDRLANGSRLELDEALLIARQIADALEAAHEQGIVHRDLKPANIKVRTDGAVKVLDFGLAKMLEAEATGRSGMGFAALTGSPTITTPATLAGVILGTAAYMSPEQARGKAVDRRADIWAFGCVLFEMLAGRQTFDAGETVSDAVASILKNDPDWRALPPDTPATVRTLLRRCLEKDPQKRLPHIGLVRIELDDPSNVPAQPVQSSAPKPLWKRALPATTAALAAAGVAVGVMWSLRPSPPRLTVMRFPFTLPEGQQFTAPYLPSVAISRDGTQMAYVANNRIYLRAMAELDARPLAGTEVTEGFLGEPAFSPDGLSLAFWTGMSPIDFTLKRISIAGGTPVPICKATFPYGTSWEGDSIVFGSGGKGAPQGDGAVQRVSASGGKPTAIASINQDEAAARPQLLPGGDAVLFTLATGIKRIEDSTAQRWDSAHVVVQSLKSGERKTLIEGGYGAQYLPTGHLVYAVGGALFAVAFDAKRLQVIGAPVPVVDGVMKVALPPAFIAGSLQLSVSDTGALVYIHDTTDFGSASPSQGELALIDRKGVATPLGVKPGPYEFPRVSPDGTRIAVGADTGRESNVWIYDLAGRSTIRQLTFGRNNRFPVWSADGERVTFQSDREGDAGIFWQRADGTAPAERLTKADQGTTHVPASWSPDGKHLLFVIARGGASSLWTWSLDDRKATAFGDVQSVFFSITPTFSPDGKWVAYTQSNAAGSSAQAFVQPFPATGAKYLVGNGIFPFWTPDGKGLFIKLGPGEPLLLFPVITQPSFTLGNPEQVGMGFRIRAPNIERENDITRDGKSFVGVVEPAARQNKPPAVPQIRIVLNWFEELKQRVPVR